ncbi:carbohydrate ABC transporter permease [Peribacillus muralis]|uniref:carbohydrate ABC transporter permease n=1 Tax=Peribacillus muralis TaxID=264697 RepID=UPI001F4E2A95|nr:carbohydrate ABC transporter permease [Peribacillus muralis]MCK1992150.1 carbohydrate ABC transporter permease [Peribacillus muralis]MCK2012706.1 carbohydrate ABC transporter permease [Peribacillus muralis]
MYLKKMSLKSLILHGLFLLVTFIWIYPLIWTISSSFKLNQELFDGSINILPKDFKWSDLLPQNWGSITNVFHIENYGNAWYVANFSDYFINTVIFSVAVVLIVVVLCGMTGYILGRYSFPGKFIFLGAITATMFIPTGYTIIPIWKLISLLGLDQSLAGLILAEAGGTHVLYILLFTAYFQGLPKELEESAQIDGAGFIRTFTTIMLPLAKPVIATTAILQFIHSWNSFFVPLIFTVHRPDLRTLGVGMYSFSEQYSTDLAGLAAGATISFIPIMIVFIFFQKYFVDGIAGAVKG